MIEQLTSKKSVVTDGVRYYLYCKSVASWKQLYSGVAAGELQELTGINAPVNCANALMNVYASLKRSAFPASDIYPSLCIGTYRRVFAIEWFDWGVILNYRPHPLVIWNQSRDPSTT